MFSVTAIILATLMTVSPTLASNTKPIWVPIPNHSSDFVDIASIRRVHLPVVRHAYPTAPNPDTRADIKVNGFIATDVDFWCDDPSMVIGDEHLVDFGAELGIIPMSAARAIECRSGNSN